jgi:uncharacterized protein (TIGR00369 family)
MPPISRWVEVDFSSPEETWLQRIPTKREVLDYVPPAGRLLGREVLAMDPEHGTVTMRYTAQPEFLNRHGTVQGGMLAAMLDSSTSLALYTMLPPELTAVTTNLNVSYVKPGKLGTFTVIAKVVSRDDRHGKTSGELRDEDGVLVATAIATLRIMKRRQQ